MARPSEVSTKTISVRIPMEDYIKFMTLALESKQTLSEFTILRIYQADQVSELKNQLEQLQKEKNTLTGKVSELEKRSSTALAEAKKAHEKSLSDANSELKRVNSEITALKTEITALKAAKTGIEKSSGTEATKLSQKVEELTTKLNQSQKEAAEAETKYKNLLKNNGEIHTQLNDFQTAQSKKMLADKIPQQAVELINKIER